MNQEMDIAVDLILVLMRHHLFHAFKNKNEFLLFNKAITESRLLFTVAINDTF